MKFGYIFFLLATSAYAEKSFIGTEVPPYPDSLKSPGGACVGGPSSTSDTCAYSIGELENSNGELVYLYAGKSLRREGEKKARWLITDVMPYPKIPKGFKISIAACRQNGIEDRTIFAVVKMDEKEWHRNVSHAHKFDFNNEKFLSIKATGIECQNEAWGL